MADFYKLEIANWNEGTAMLTLEQEAAYLRVVNAIRQNEQPITLNTFALCGMWRCNERKAKRLLGELIAAGKLSIEDGRIVNRKAVDDASALSRLRVERQSAGHRGGVESGKSRSKQLTNKETDEAIASTREEKRRVEENSSSRSPNAHAPEREADDGPQPPPVVITEEADDLYSQVLHACGLKSGGLPTYWMPPGAIIHVNRWLTLGLTSDEILSAVRASRQNHADPPSGPKALDRVMTSLASAKQMPALKPATTQIAGGYHASNAARTADRQERDRRILQAAVRGSTD